MGEERHVLSFCIAQNCFHSETEQEYIANNMKILVEQNKQPHYSAVYFGSHNECIARLRELEPVLRNPDNANR